VTQSGLLLDDETRAALWAQVTERIEGYLRAVGEDGALRATPEPGLTAAAVRDALRPLTFDAPMAPADAVDLAARWLTDAQVHTPHPRYFGLFNPAPTTMGVAADALVAAFNPQLAAWSHNPFANEVERHLIRALGSRGFGYDEETTDGTFCSGGAEANHTALLCALTAAFPEFAEGGARALSGQPVFYVSGEAHHSWHKAARACGIGAAAVREAPVGPDLRMDVPALDGMIAEDRAAGRLPFLLVATAGTTNAGAIDPIAETAWFAARERLWFHVDAAWGGAAALVPELRPLLDGVFAADSITFDAHKWLSVPMGAGLFLTRHPDILSRTFDVLTAYMPGGEEGTADPYRHSLQWSRRATGMKVFLSLLVAGWDGYAAALRHQTAMGALLRARLTDDGWRVVNDTPLPLVCFVDGRAADGDAAPYLDAVAAHVVASGRAWCSTTRLGPGRMPALRACVTNYRTAPADVDALVAALNDARRAVFAG
jgi:glutamate/tyrosine decarboxylase-like PLP-dependent enzyme